MAKEAGLCYAAVAMATDYDCWRDKGDHVCVADVFAMFKKNVSKVVQILTTSVSIIAKEDWTDTITNLKVKQFLNQLSTKKLIFFFFFLEHR